MPTLSFHYPQLLVLLLLLPLAWKRLAGSRLTVSSILRLALLALAVAALAGPRLRWRNDELDLVVLVDRSASCGPQADAMLRELLPLLRNAEKPGDRTAVVAFGAGAEIERGFAGGGGPLDDGFVHASDLAAGIRLAVAMRAPSRRSAILCLSDGRFTGDDPEKTLAGDLASLPFWYREVGGAAAPDAAAGGIVLPDEVEPGSAWLVRFAIHAEGPMRAHYRLERDGLVLARGTADLRRGANHFFARDTVAADGMLRYRLEVGVAGDPQPANNIATALLRVRGQSRALLVSAADEPGLIHRALTAAAIPFDVVSPQAFPGSPALLEPYRLAILENCRLSDFPGRSVQSLAASVEAGLISVLVTGGPNSFGSGGYHRSALDPLLPVDMELRNEQRRGTMAVVFALDRSGSMAMSAGGGMTKMDLANLGTAESIHLLSPRDQVSVIAVDSSPHVIVPLSIADDAGRLARTVRGIQSMGGGIYCHAALEAAEAEIVKSSLPARHIVLFADASDAEDQEGCFDLAKRLRRDGVLISVIAMGEPTDADAEFLRELARHGGGEALFSSHAAGLPALFTQEIMRVSKRGFVEESATPRPLPALELLGLSPAATFTVGGVNVAGAREGAVVYMHLDDEFRSPVVASRNVGKAETGVVLFEVDGDFSGSFPEWSEAPGLIASLSRRLAAGAALTRVKAYSRLERGIAETRLEFSPEAARSLRQAAPVMRWLGPEGQAVETELEWVEADAAVARLRLDRPGHYLPLANLPGLGLAAAPPLSLPYSAEFAIDSRRDGGAVLRSLAGLSGGGDGLDISEVRQSATALRAGAVELRPWLLLAVLALFLAELSGRRLLWFRNDNSQFIIHNS